MVKLAAACATLLSCLAFAPASSAAPSQPSFTVQLMTANGSGCPPGSTSVSQPNSTEFTIIYSSYIATAGGGAAPTDFRKNCQLNVRVGVPAGFTYGIIEVDYRGYAQLDTGAQGILEADYYFSGTSPTYMARHPLSGPYNDDYEFSDPVVTAVWAPCHFNGTLNVNTSVRVSAGSNPSFLDELTVDSHDFSTRTIYHIGLEKC